MKAIQFLFYTNSHLLPFCEWLVSAFINTLPLLLLSVIFPVLLLLLLLHLFLLFFLLLFILLLFLIFPLLFPSSPPPHLAPYDPCVTNNHKYQKLS